MGPGLIARALAVACDPGNRAWYVPPRIPVLAPVPGVTATMARKNAPHDTPAVKGKPRVPRKGDIVLYRDPDSAEACAAIVCKVHHPGEPNSVLNLKFFTEEGQDGAARNVARGTGQFETWNWPGEPDAPNGPDPEPAT